MKQAMIAGVSAAIAMTIIAGVAGGGYYVFVHKPESERLAAEQAKENAQKEWEERQIRADAEYRKVKEESDRERERIYEGYRGFR